MFIQQAPRHFLDISQFNNSTLRSILNKAIEFKKAGKNYDKPLLDHTLVLIFEKPSTRTRVSFEVGMRQLGGDVVVLGNRDSQLGQGESISDTARVLSRFSDAIMIRTDSHQKLELLAEYSSVPVINGLTDDSHPCQIMADIMTFEEHRGSIEGKTISWVGDGNNVATSWLHAAVKFNFNFKIATDCTTTTKRPNFHSIVTKISPFIYFVESQIDPTQIDNDATATHESRIVLF